jgi:hypothetical protein
MNRDFLVAIRIFLSEQSLEGFPDVDHDGGALFTTGISLIGPRPNGQEVKEDQPRKNDNEETMRGHESGEASPANCSTMDNRFPAPSRTIYA